jgi:hypothetical protein
MGVPLNKYSQLVISDLDGIERDKSLIYVNGRAFKTSATVGRVALALSRTEEVQDIDLDVLSVSRESYEKAKTTIDSIISRSEEKKKWNRRLHLVFFKIPLTKENRIIRLLSGLFSRRIAPVLLAAGFLSLLFWMGESISGGFFNEFPTMILRRFNGYCVLYTTLLSLVLIALHELGHASALRHFGESASEFGGGLYFITPTFFCNVNAAWKLRRRQRIVVSLGGVYFELLFSILCVPVFFAFRDVIPSFGNWLIIFIIFNCLGMLSNLYPGIFLDGYWLALDIFGIQNNGQVIRTLLARMAGRWKRRRGPAPARAEDLFTGMSRIRAFFLAAFSLFSYGMYLVMTLIMLRYAVTYIGWKLPHFISSLAQLGRDDIFEALWGALLSFSVFFMLCKKGKAFLQRRAKEGNARP